MADFLVIIRHAQAKSRKDGIADEKRKLTTAGKRSCIASLQRIKPLFVGQDANQMQLWSSPALRATQTADIAAKLLGIDHIEIHDSLYDDNTSCLLDELCKANGLVIVVGHNPFLEDLFELLSGYRQPLKKCGAAAFDLRKSVSGSSQLMWLVQGLDCARYQTLITVEKALARCSKRIQKSANVLRENPNDAEALHQYRIALRKTRSLVSFISFCLKNKQASFWKKTIKKLQDQTSYLRELDVLYESLETCTAEVKDAKELLKRCAMSRAKQRRHLIKKISSKQTCATLESLRQSLMAPKWRKKLVCDPLLREEFIRRFDERYCSWSEACHNCDFTDIKQVHSIRKRAKGLRYVARDLQSLLGRSCADRISQTKTMQDQLGKFCDAHVNAQRARALGAASMDEEPDGFIACQQKTIASIVASARKQAV